MKRFPFSPVTLSIPSDLSSLSILLITVREICRLFQLGENESMQLELGVEEAFSNIVKYSFSENDNEVVRATFVCDDLGIRVELHDYGAPIDPELFPVYSVDSLRDNYQARGLGLFLMRKFVDETEFVNLGKHGK